MSPPSTVRSEEGGDDGDEDGCGLRASTWVKKAAIKTIENGAATASPAARRRVPSGLITNKRLVGGDPAVGRLGGDAGAGGVAGSQAGRLRAGDEVGFAG
jgi:hypothetical protein